MLTSIFVFAHYIKANLFGLVISNGSVLDFAWLSVYSTRVFTLLELGNALSGTIKFA
jgi:hypothetical protein